MSSTNRKDAKGAKSGHPGKDSGSFFSFFIRTWYHSSLVTDINQAQQHTARTSYDVRAVRLPGAVLLATIIFRSMD